MLVFSRFGSLLNHYSCMCLSLILPHAIRTANEFNEILETTISISVGVLVSYMSSSFRSMLQFKEIGAHVLRHRHELLILQNSVLW